MPEQDHVRDPYDFRAPGFVPDEYNSLRIVEKSGPPSSASELKAAAEAMVAELREEATTTWGDSEVIVYDGDLYIVGDYIRNLVERQSRGNQRMTRN